MALSENLSRQRKAPDLDRGSGPATVGRGGGSPPSQRSGARPRTFNPLVHPVGIGHTRSSSGQRGKNMLYAILCYNSEDVVGSWTKEEDDAVMAQLAGRARQARRQGKLGPVARLMPTTAATTVRKGREPIVIDGPFAETKEQLLGFYVVDCASLEEAIESRAIWRARDATGPGAYEIRPICALQAGRRRDVTDLAWIDAALTVGAPAGDRRAAALFPRSRPGRGGLSGSLPARAEDLAEERPAARSRRLADLRRPQRRARRGAPAQQAGGAAGRGVDLRSRRRRGRRSPSGSTARTIATTCCACCSSAAIRICRRRSRSRSRCASSPAFRSSRSRAPSWSSESGDGAAHHARQAPHRRSRRAVRDAGRGGARRAARRGRRDDLPRSSTRATRRAAARRISARRCARRRSASPGCCCGCSRASPRSWG